MTIEKLREKNPGLEIYSVDDGEFTPYGRKVKGYDFGDFLKILESKEIPEDGNTYCGADSELMALSVVQEISNDFYAEMEIEAGYCNGRGTKLNALEYHRGSEIDIAGEDLILLLDQISSIENNHMDSGSVKGFFVPAGTAVQIFETTLHFAPCRIRDEGFRCGVILPAHTNEPLSCDHPVHNEEDHLLWMRNKWLIAHRESIPASRGAFVGISGPNIEVHY